MRKVTLNNSFTDRIDSFSRSYDFSNEPYIENINMNIYTEHINNLVALQKSKITDIVINDGEEEVYSLHNLNGKITYVNESISNNNQTTVSVQIKVTHNEVSE